MVPTYDRLVVEAFASMSPMTLVVLGVAVLCLTVMALCKIWPVQAKPMPNKHIPY